MATKVKKARPVEQAVSEFQKITEARFRIAMDVYNEQDNLSKEVIDRIRDRLVIASTGVVQINGKPYKLEPKYIDFNIMFLAIEILSDLYMKGIKVGTFKPSKLFCEQCGKELLGVKKPKKR